jgi:Mn-dependent DtxR family transcriptional regulator
MIKVNVHDKDAQLVVLKTLYPESGVKMRIEGELELYDITEALVVELFKNLLHKNLVSEVTFSYVEEKRSKEEVKNVQKSQRYGTLTENVYGFLEENIGRAFSIKEISEKTGIEYSSVNNIIRRLYNNGKVQKNDEKKYFCPIKSANVERPSHEAIEESSVEEEKKEPAGDEGVQSKEAGTPQRGDSSEAAEEDETKKLSESEKRDIMQHLFLNEAYEDVLKYIFSTKNKFVVKLAQKKFAGPQAQQLSDVIAALNKAEAIVFNDDFSDGGSYEISLSWRIWAYLFRAKRKVASKTIEVELQMKPSEFKAGIKEALEKGLVEKEEDEKLKITTYCVV